MKARNGHERYRELMSARLDGQLSVIAERQLARHLRACAVCQAIQNDYFEQRRKLHTLRPLEPPRDLWARTSAALDREVAREPLWPGQRPSRRLPRVAFAGSLTAVVLALVVGTGELGLAPSPRTVEASQAPVALLPTPFSVAPQRMTLLGSDGNGLVLYRTEVDQVCPATAPSCMGEDDLAPQILALPQGLRPANLTVSPDGERVAMSGTVSGRQGIFAFVLDDDQALSEPPDAPTSSQPDPSPSSMPPSSEPEPPSSEPVPPSSDPQTPSVDPEPPSSEPVPASEPPASATPGDQLVSPPTATPGPWTTADVTASAGASLAPTPSTAPALATVTILADADLAGAPPAWSADGQLLAFSAMPADGSHGPDIYVWREGDQQAVPLTTDHATYFASWAGQRIVASRSSVTDELAPSFSLQTIVIDPASGEERAVATDDLWLPQVSPRGGQAVVWRGSLELTEDRPRPLIGSLYLVDWSALDPFPISAEDLQPTDDAQPTPAAGDSPQAADDETPARAPGDSGSPEPRRSSAPSPSEPAAARNEPASDPASPQPAPSETIPPLEPTELDVLPLDPQRDPLASPVLDWHVRWSADGSVVGVWVAERVGASWGQLVVVPVTAEASELAVGEPLLGPTVARRSFTLGISRVAWVGASEGEPQGEVRIRTWGPGGEGGLDLPALDVREVVPAF